jgi:hypothetical protein
LGNFAGAVRYCCGSAVAVSEEENKKLVTSYEPAARFRHRAVTMFLLWFGRGEESFLKEWLIAVRLHVGPVSSA